MRGVAVGLRDEPLQRPQEVGLRSVAAPEWDPGVHARARNAAAGTQRQEPLLELAPRERRVMCSKQHSEDRGAAVPVRPAKDSFDRRSVEQPKHVGTVDRSVGAPAVDGYGQVEQSPGNAGAGDAALRRDVGFREEPRTVGLDAGPDAPGDPLRGHVRDGAGVGAQPPERGGGAMGEHGLGATGENRRHPPSLGGEEPMPHGVDAAVHRMQPSRPHAAADGARAEPDRPQLPEGDHPVLPPRQRGDGPVHRGWLTFRPVFRRNVNHPPPPGEDDGPSVTRRHAPRTVVPRARYEPGEARPRSAVARQTQAARTPWSGRRSQSAQAGTFG